MLSELRNDGSVAVQKKRKKKKKPEAKTEIVKYI